LSSVYRNSLLGLAGFGILALPVGILFGAAWGWGGFALALLGIVFWHTRHLARLERWLANPLPGAVPEGQGIWDEVLSALHRLERETARREEGLADALARMRRAVQALPDGVVILDSANRIEWFNRTAEAQLQLDVRADLGQNIANLLRQPEFIEYLETAGAEPVRIARGPGLALSLQLIPFGQSQKMLLSRDVTQAERVDLMRRDFVANVSHELRTPLTVLVGFLETVRELKLDPQRVRDYLGMMQDQASRMQRIIEDLLTLSVLESAPPPPADRVRVAPLLARLRADAEALSGGRHAVALQGSPAVDLVGSEAELSSAFGNLVSNAVRYTPSGGKVNLMWREGPEGVAFVVEDTGIGIDAEHIPRLTERFYRVDRSRSRETGGTGLGLAIAKHALARHDATLEIESQPGKGSRFSARFPARRLASKNLTV